MGWWRDGCAPQRWGSEHGPYRNPTDNRFGTNASFMGTGVTGNALEAIRVIFLRKLLSEGAPDSVGPERPTNWQRRSHGNEEAIQEAI